MSKFNGQKLTEIRHLFGMTQYDVAELIGVNIHKFIEIEQSRITPEFNQVQILCKRFYVKPKYFYSKSDLPDVVNPNYISLRR
ncbi:helix-turn-helix transcriptional regulator [Bacillus cereus]|nr:helix-turn-helix transcriptional regulator [Bacillus cereus]